MDKEESMTTDERLESLEERISEIYRRVGYLEGTTEQLGNRFKSYENRLNRIQYGSMRNKEE